MMSIYRYSLLAATLLPLIGCNQSVVTEPSVSLEASAADQNNGKRAQFKSSNLNRDLNKPAAFTGKLQSVETAGGLFAFPYHSRIVSKNWRQRYKGQAIAQLDPHDYQVAPEGATSSCVRSKIGS
ncbi:hypothetical protein O9992_18735 [Vibrio lentus]|nr:hypothetical protein [Vibrio lentus]